MLVAQVGLGDVVSGIPYAIAEMFASGAAVLGLALGVVALGTTLFTRQLDRPVVYHASVAIFCLAVYFMWWWGIEAVPTEWPFFLAAVGGAMSGAWAIWRVARCSCAGHEDRLHEPAPSEDQLPG